MKKILTLLLLLLIPSTTLAADLESFSVYPKILNGINPTLFVFEAKPGSTINDTVIVDNKADVKQIFNIYPTEAFINSEGTLEYIDPFMEQQYSSWITVEKDKIELESHTTGEINFSINIPEDANKTPYILGIAVTRQKRANDEKQVTIVSRFVSPIKLLVTDDPQYIPTQDEVLAQEAAERERQALMTSTLTPTPFFYGSIAIFLACAAYLIVSFRRDRKKKKAAIKN